MDGEGEDYEDTKVKKKNIFDDDVSDEAAKKILTSARFDEEDYESDFVHLGASQSTSVQYGTSKTMPDLSSLATPVPSFIPSPASFHTPTCAPEPKHAFGSFHKATSHVRSQSLTFAPSKVEPVAFSKINTVNSTSGSASSLTIEEAVGMGRRVGSMDMEQMQQEVQQLRKQLRVAKNEKWSKTPVDFTLRYIMNGKPYSLACYRALADKLALLDQAIALMDGNAVTAAVLHLKNTVRQSIFHQELLQRPVAANHYLAYLRGHFEYAELIETLLVLGRSEEAAITEYKMACNSSDTGTKVAKLKSCLRSRFETDPSLSNEAACIREHVDLLERQWPIEDSDAKAEADGRTRIFQAFPRRRSLLNMPVTTTLFYCSLYHYHLQESNFACPLSIKKRHEIPERQYVWTALSARAKARGWTDIEQLLTAKGWFGGKKMKAAIGFDKVVEILHKFQAPGDILSKYLELVDDLDSRLSLSQKTGCRKVTIETLIKQKDRAGVENFAQMHPSTVEGEHARRVLREEAGRWK